MIRSTAAAVLLSLMTVGTEPTKRTSPADASPAPATDLRPISDADVLPSAGAPPALVSLRNVRHVVARYKLTTTILVYNDGTIETSTPIISSVSNGRVTPTNENSRADDDAGEYPGQCTATAISTGRRCRVKAPISSSRCRYHR